MTGLERRVPIFPGPQFSLRRYLTPFHSLAPGIVLGLAILLVLSACSRAQTGTPGPTVTQASPGQTTEPSSFGIQSLTKGTATSLPPIPATPNERTPSPLGVSAAQLKGLQVSLWHPWSGATGASFQTIVDRFNSSNQWGITVKTTSYTDFGRLDDAMQTAMQTGSPPDIVVDYGYQARQWDLSGVLADLTPYVDDPVWGLTGDEQADFYPAFWAEDLAGNHSQPTRLGVPYYRSAYGLFYNQSWAEQLGYPAPPTTPEDFRVRACAAAEAIRQAGDKTNLGHGGWLITPEPATLTGWIYAFGGNLTNPDGTGYLYDTPATSQALTYLKALQDSGCAWTDSSVDPQTAFASRQALFVVGSLFDITSQQAAFAKSGALDDWVVIPFPSNTQPVMLTYGPSLFISSSTPERQLAAWLAIEWLVYPPNQADFAQQLGVYPTRQGALRYFIHTEQANTQWAQALGWLPDARGEPGLPSWSMMRWALADASTQLFSPQFGADQIPALLGKLDSVGAEIYSQVP